MKSTHNIFMMLLLLSMIGCSGLLDEEPTTFYNEEQVFSTEEGVETAVNGLWYSYGGPEYYGSSGFRKVLVQSGRKQGCHQPQYLPDQYLADQDVAGNVYYH